GRRIWRSLRCGLGRRGLLRGRSLFRLRGGGFGRCRLLAWRWHSGCLHQVELTRGRRASSSGDSFYEVVKPPTPLIWWARAILTAISEGCGLVAASGKLPRLQIRDSRAEMTVRGFSGVARCRRITTIGNPRGINALTLSTTIRGLSTPAAVWRVLSAGANRGTIMAYNPFNIFRRNQKAIFAVVTVFIMFTFVLSSGLRGGADFFDWLPRWLGSKTKKGEVICTINGNKIYEGELTQLRLNR